MNKQTLLSCVCLLAAMHCGVAAGASDPGSGDCPRFDFAGNLLGESDVEFVQENILGPFNEGRWRPRKFMWLAAGRFFYRDSDGSCIQADDTYLVAALDFLYPQIIESVRGHTLSAKMDTIGGDYILSVSYHREPGQFALNMYKLVMGVYGLECRSIEVEGRPFNAIVSNMNSIKMKDDRIVAKNSVQPAEGKGRELLVETYRYQDGKFVHETESAD